MELSLARRGAEVVKWLLSTPIGVVLLWLFGPRGVVDRGRSTSPEVVRPTVLMPAEQGIVRLSATALAAKIRTREVTSVEAVQAYIKRIKEVNGLINAMVAERFAAALDEAALPVYHRAVDRRIARGDLDPKREPFAGVPCAVKELSGMFGCHRHAAHIRYLCGVVARGVTHAASAVDATGVARLRAAGAIVLGVTNTSEMCCWVESYNVRYGRTLNPHARACTAGGSSGGDGALMASAGAAFSLATDVAGSIRFPSAFCGVFGHKPSGGFVPSTGDYPVRSGKQYASFNTIGPIVRHAEDLYPLLMVLAGPDGVDPSVDGGGAAPFPAMEPAAVDLRSIHICAWPTSSNNAYSISLDIQNALTDALRHLRDVTKCPTDTIDLPKALRPDYATILCTAAFADQPPPSFGQMMGLGSVGSLLGELARLCVGRSDYTLMSLVFLLNEWTEIHVFSDTAVLAASVEPLRHEMEALLAGNRVLLYPIYSSVAPEHGVPILRPSDVGLCAIWNLLQMPSTAIPIGRSGNRGLPVAIQAVAARGNDHLTLAVARELERAFGGAIVPRAVPVLD